MNAASDGLGLAGDLLIVCLILSVGIVVGKMSKMRIIRLVMVSLIADHGFRASIMRIAFYSFYS